VPEPVGRWVAGKRREFSTEVPETTRPAEAGLV